MVVLLLHKLVIIDGNFQCVRGRGGNTSSELEVCFSENNINFTVGKVSITDMSDYTPLYVLIKEFNNFNGVDTEKCIFFSLQNRKVKDKNGYQYGWVNDKTYLTIDFPISGYYSIVVLGKK